MTLRVVTITVIAFIASSVAVNAQTDLLDGRNIERIYVDRSDAPYVTVTYDLDLKSNTTKSGMTNAFEITTIIPKSVSRSMVAQGFEIRCEERLIRFATASDIKLDNGKLVMGTTRELPDEIFANPYTDRV